MEAGIELHSLCKIFGEIKALWDVNISIPKGKIVGLLGRNGAGKTTLVRLLSGVMRPSSGTAKVYGFDLNSQLEDVKRNTGLLPEEYALYDKLSVFEYVEFIAKLYDLSSEELKERFALLSSKLGIFELRNRMIETLSKGQKQKVAIITAMIHEPKVLFFDEPITNLDVQSQKVVKQLIRDYKDQSRVIVIATHLMTNVEEICDDLLIIDNGKILFSGSVKAFQGKFESLEAAYLSFTGEW